MRDTFVLILLSIVLSYLATKSKNLLVKWLPVIVLFAITLTCVTMVQLMPGNGDSLYFLFGWVFGVCLIASFIFTIIFLAMRRNK